MIAVESWKKMIYKMFDLLYIPESLEKIKGRVVLHVSDTPSSFYSCLNKLVTFLDPLAIIHTGDLVDEIKLGLLPNRLALYSKKLRLLARILEGEEKRKVCIVTGNHDNKDVVEQVFHTSQIVNWSGSFDVCGLKLNVSHDFQGLPSMEGDLNLFGHNEFVPQSDSNKTYLNGLMSIHCIVPDNGDIYTLPYPRFVDQNRLLKRKCGL